MIRMRNVGETRRSGIILNIVFHQATLLIDHLPVFSCREARAVQRSCKKWVWSNLGTLHFVYSDMDVILCNLSLGRQHSDEQLAQFVGTNQGIQYFHIFSYRRQINLSRPDCLSSVLLDTWIHLAYFVSTFCVPSTSTDQS